MSVRCSVRVSLLTVAFGAISVLAPAAARGQGWTFSVAGGTATPTRPTSSLVTIGGQLAFGASHQSAESPLSFGVELGAATFSETHLDYAVVYPCTAPGCVARTPSTTNLTLANYLATAKYALGSGTTRPYLAVAAGLAQRLSSGTWHGAYFDHAYSNAERASVGVESHLGTLGVALDVSYTAAGFAYEDHPVRYVPVTLRLTF